MSADFLNPTNLVSTDHDDVNLSSNASDVRRISNVGMASQKGPRRFLGKSRFSKQIQLSNFDTTFEHGLEFYGNPEFRAVLTPLTLRVIRSMISAQKRFHSYALVSDGHGPLPSASPETSTTLAELVGRPHYRFSLGGGKYL